jgi:hypothetical protein
MQLYFVAIQYKKQMRLETPPIENDEENIKATTPFRDEPSWLSVLFSC